MIVRFVSKPPFNFKSKNKNKILIGLHLLCLKHTPIDIVISIGYLRFYREVQIHLKNLMMVVMVQYGLEICQYASKELKRTKWASSYNFLTCALSPKHIPTQTTMYNANVH